jgi:hypothetical protein
MKPPNALAIISLCMSKKLSAGGGRVMRRLRSSEAPTLLQPSADGTATLRRRNCLRSQCKAGHAAERSQNIIDIFKNSIDILTNSIDISTNIIDILSLFGAPFVFPPRQVRLSAALHPTLFRGSRTAKSL